MTFRGDRVAKISTNSSGLVDGFSHRLRTLGEELAAFIPSRAAPQAPSRAHLLRTNRQHGALPPRQGDHIHQACRYITKLKGW